MQDNERRDCQLIVGTKEESLVVLVDDGRLVEMERRLIVNGNPPEFFDLLGKVLTMEEINHPVATLVTALQEEELAPLMVVQLPNVERWCGGTELSKTDG